MAAFDPRDRNEVGAAKGNAGYGGGGMGGNRSGAGGGFGGGRTASVIGNRFGAPSASAQVAAQRRNAPTNATFAGQGGLNARRTQNPTPSYEMSLHNMWELGKLVSGLGNPPKSIAGAILGGVTGLNSPMPDFRGYTGMVNGPGDYDGPNRFGVNGSSLFPNPGVRPVQAAGAAQQPTAPLQGMTPLQVPGQQLNIPGPSQYGVNLPSYGYFGQPPGQVRPPRTPMSMIMGGI